MTLPWWAELAKAVGLEAVDALKARRLERRRNEATAQMEERAAYDVVWLTMNGRPIPPGTLELAERWHARRQ